MMSSTKSDNKSWTRRKLILGEEKYYFWVTMKSNSGGPVAYQMITIWPQKQGDIGSRLKTSAFECQIIVTSMWEAHLAGERPHVGYDPYKYMRLSISVYQEKGHTCETWHSSCWGVRMACTIDLPPSLIQLTSSHSALSCVPSQQNIRSPNSTLIHIPT